VKLPNSGSKLLVNNSISDTAHTGISNATSLSIFSIIGAPSRVYKTSSVLPPLICS